MKKSEIDPTVQSIQELFGFGVHFQIPEYQRNYSWESDEVSEFLDDTSKAQKKNEQEEKDDDYLMGQILICPNHRPPTGLPKTVDSVEVIDGQQRLTTIYATFLVLLGKIDTDWLKDQTAGTKQAYDQWMSLKFMANDEDPDTPVLRVSSSYVGREFWDAIYLGEELPEAATPSEQNLSSAIGAIKNFADKDLSSNEAIWEYLSFLMNKVVVITLRLPTSQKALQMFMNLNNRGMKLDPSDIIKAYFFRMADRDSYKTLSDLWGNAQDELLAQKQIKSITSMQTLMRMMIQTTIGDYVPQNDIFDKWEEYFNSQADIPDSVRRVTEVLPTKAKNLVLISRRKVPAEEGTTLSELRGIDVTKARSMYEVLLAGSDLTAESFRELSRIVEARTVLQSLSSTPFNILEPKIHIWGNRVSKLDGMASREDILEASKGVLKPTDLSGPLDNLLQGLLSLSYSKRADRLALRYVLARVNRFIHGMFDASPKPVDSLMVTKTPANPSGYDIDHIFPKAEHRREFWTKSQRQDRLMGEQDRSTAVINSIGNLALLKHGDNEYSGDELPWEESKLSSYKVSELRICELLATGDSSLLSHPPYNAAATKLDWPKSLTLDKWNEDSTIELAAFYARVLKMSLQADLGLET